MVGVVDSLLLHHIHSTCSVILEPLSLGMNIGAGSRLVSSISTRAATPDGLSAAPTIAGRFRSIDDAPNFGDSLD